MINIPITDTLAFRASGSYRKQGGYIDSIGTAGSRIDHNFNDFQSYGGRASLLWKPDSRLSVRLSALLQNLSVDGAPSFVETDPATLKPRSEEHTSELQSLMRISYAVFCLKKKNTTTNDITRKK